MQGTFSLKITWHKKGLGASGNRESNLTTYTTGFQITGEKNFSDNQMVYRRLSEFRRFALPVGFLRLDGPRLL